MEIPFRSAAVSTLVHATEDEHRVLEALRTLLPEGVEVRRSKLRGHHGNPIVGIEARLGGRKLREFWQNLAKKLRAEELKKIKLVAPKRVDDDCFFYLRFDKQLASIGEIAMTESGDAIHLRLKVASFPARREVAVKLVEQFLKSMG